MDEQTAVAAPPAPPAPTSVGVGGTGEPPRPRRPLWLRLLIGLGWTVLGLLLVAALLYKFGSMWVPTSEQRAAYAATVQATGVQPEVTKQFHIPIPGCVCHSDDPVRVIEHESRRISECMGCHGGR